MARPTRDNVQNGVNGWDATINDNFIKLFDRPLAPFLHANTLTDLQSTYPAASYAWCLAIVEYDGATTPGNHLAFSNGTAWKLISNWEFINRRVLKSVSSTYSIADADDLIVVTGSSNFTITMPAIADGNEGRMVYIKHTGTGIITVDGNGSDTIDGGANHQLGVQYESAIYVSDGTSNWHLISKAASGGGGFTDYISRCRSSGTEAVPASAGTLMDLPTLHKSQGSAISWNGTNKEFDINATGTYMIHLQGVFDGPSGQSRAAQLTRDTGTGHAVVAGVKSLVGGSGTLRSACPAFAILDLNSGDKLGITMWATTTGGNSIEGTSMMISKIA